jgi:hypothetical protein
MMGQTALLQCTAPITCTSITKRKSDNSILEKLLSRKIPALLTKMSTRPHAHMACCTMALTASKSVTEALLAMA